jgi:membrane-associated protease RseP (regulator of RpoE activity)
MLSDTGDTSTVAGTETTVQTPQPVDPPRAESSPRANGWFNGGVRIGIIAAVVVVVAGAFFTIGWFTSTRGDHGRLTLTNGIHQKMNMGERGNVQGGTDQQGANQRRGYSDGGGGMVIPQQGQGQGQAVPTPQSPSNGQSNQQGQSNSQGQSAQQGYLGVGVETVTPALQQQIGLSRSDGVLVASIDGSGPAFKAGIQQGDIITSIDGASVTQQQDVVSLIEKMNAGDRISVVIDRNGQSLTVEVTLGGRPASVTG